ncbi:chymotrypsinogen A-like [Lutzomyia longipalpis]|uniref:chymotrypsinogen A-like n=1 Tax=Lutzomyia longipalpis TaxID=7200 RepID=UPI002483510F|nr:chymotrypsinogen A-like [Lutzomyia longipalpis]
MAIKVKRNVFLCPKFQALINVFVKPFQETQQVYVEGLKNKSDDVITRIINGEIATEGQFPYQVRLIMYGSSNCTARRLRCGGSIIAKNWVLTAGHCTAPTPGLLDTFFVFEVEAGSVIAEEPRQRKLVLASNSFPHPEYNPNTLENDLGLVKMDSYFDFSTPYVKPVPLVAANTDKASYVGQIVTASGFGYIENDGPVSNELRYTQLQVMDFATCVALPAYSGDDLPDTSFCADGIGDPKGATCSGDSGGPITLIMNGKTIQIGIVSYGSNDGCDAAPGGYTNVAQFIPWIQSVMRENKY